MATSRQGTPSAARKPTPSDPPVTDTRTRGGTPYPPMPAATVQAVCTYLDQLEAHQADPAKHPAPDLSLLAVQPSGPLTAVWIDEHEGRPVVAFKVANYNLKPRHSPPEVWPAVLGPILYGGGLSPNDNTGDWEGLAYLRWWGGNERMMVTRALTDASPDDVVRLSSPAGEVTDHRSSDPRFLSTVPYRQVRDEEGRPLRKPRRGREFVIETALTFHDKNAHRSDAKLTREEYRQLLTRAFRANDVYRFRLGTKPRPSGSTKTTPTGQGEG